MLVSYISIPFLTAPAAGDFDEPAEHSASEDLTEEEEESEAAETDPDVTVGELENPNPAITTPKDSYGYVTLCVDHAMYGSLD